MLTRIPKTVLVLAALSFSAAAAPNFSGHWKLNPAKSKLPDDSMREERTIDHKDPELTVNAKGVVDGEEQESTTKYRTDGKETKSDIDGDPMFSTAHWDGEALVIQSTLISDTDTTEFQSRWTLSADGKTLTIAHKQKTGNDEQEMLLVFDLV